VAIPSGASYGWRARIGFIQPSAGNPNHPHEFYLLVPDGVTISLMGLRSLEDPPEEFLSKEGLDRTVRRLPAAAKVLAAQPVDVIVQAGVPHLTAQPYGIEEKVRADVAAVTDIPLVIDVRASIDAMKALGMTKVLMVSPFTEAASVQVADYVKHDGLGIIATHRVNAGPYGGLYTIPLGSVYQEVKVAHRRLGGSCDGIWLPGAAMPSVGLIDVLERDLGVPVVSSKQAMVWAALRTARVFAAKPGYGRLFEGSL
jgi:maleate isomerase